LHAGVQCYSHNDEKDPWIEFSFVNHFVFPKHYSIRGDHNTGNGYTFRNWTFEATNGNGQWTQLTTHLNDTSMGCTPSAHASWTISPHHSWPERGFQTFRLRKTGNNGRAEKGGADFQHMMIQGVEIYGKMFLKVYMKNLHILAIYSLL